MLDPNLELWQNSLSVCRGALQTPARYARHLRLVRRPGACTHSFRSLVPNQGYLSRALR